MSGINCKIHPEQPDNCPPDDASPAALSLFRALLGNDPVHDDFLSHVERELCDDLTDCGAFGLSVWTTEAAVETARSVIPGFRRKCIIKFSISLTDGLLKNTPSDTQPDHWTFWRSTSFEKPPAKYEVFIQRGSR